MYGHDPNDEPQVVTFHLRGVIVHLGTMSAGHYITYTCSTNGLWYEVNDDSVRRVLPAEVTSATRNAYMFLFERDIEVRCVSVRIGSPDCNVSNAILLTR